VYPLLRSQNAIGSEVPANCKDADLHKYLKDGVALNKVIVPKAGQKTHDPAKFKFHHLDNLKVWSRLLCNYVIKIGASSFKGMYAIFSQCFQPGICGQCEG
jgi:hypothetical protein